MLLHRELKSGQCKALVAPMELADSSSQGVKNQLGPSGQEGFFLNSSLKKRKSDKYCFLHAFFLDLEVY